MSPNTIPARYPSIEEVTGRILKFTPTGEAIEVFNRSKPNDGKRFRAMTFAMIEPNLNEEWLVDDIAPRQGVLFAYGNPEAGKTFAILDVALHVASGRPYAGKRVEHSAVFYFAAEGGLGFKKRVAAARLGKKFPDDTRFALITDRPDLGSKEGDAATIIEAIREQLAVVGGTSVGMVVLDTLNKIANGADENSATEMGVLLNNVERIANELGCLVVVVHHDGKDADRGMRGSVALRGGCDAIWKVEVRDGQRSVSIERMKDGETGLMWQFELVALELGVNQFGKPVTSCHVDVKSTPQHAAANSNERRKSLRGQPAEFMKAMRMAIDAMGREPPASNNIPAGVRCVTRSELKEYAAALGFFEGKEENSVRAVLSRHVRDLAGNGHLGQWNDWVWIP